jgi:hypothetical protein
LTERLCRRLRNWGQVRNAGKVDVVVVYKISRLTCSLFDVAKVAETFDAGHVSFVSVAQPSNTTTSMGRLTLNVLLCFAWFEREVSARLSASSRSPDPIRPRRERQSKPGLGSKPE